MLNEITKQNIIDMLTPKIRQLADNLPRHGEISLKAKICDYKVGTINIGVEISQKIPKTGEGE